MISSCRLCCLRFLMDKRSRIELSLSLLSGILLMSGRTGQGSISIHGNTRPRFFLRPALSWWWHHDSSSWYGVCPRPWTGPPLYFWHGVFDGIMVIFHIPKMDSGTFVLISGFSVEGVTSLRRK